MRSPDSPRGVVVLMHGVNGHPLESWGPPDTPGAFATRLRQDLPGVEVMSYAHRSPLMVTPGHEATTLASLVDDWIRFMTREVLPDRDRIVLVGHCLGGLIARFGLARLLADAVNLRPQWSLFALDTPEDWSDGPLREPLASIVATLGLTEPAMRANAAWWRDRSGPAGAVNDHAVISSQFSWVAPFKRGSTVAHAACVDVPHVELTRAPLVGQHAAYDYVAGHLRVRLQTPAVTTHG